MLNRIRSAIAIMSISVAMMFCIVPSASAESYSKVVEGSNECRMSIAMGFTRNSSGWASSNEVRNCSEVSVYFVYDSNGVEHRTREASGYSSSYIDASDVDFIKISMHRGYNMGYSSTHSLYPA